MCDEVMEVTDSRRVVIAGGTGFLGQSLAGYLAKRGAELVRSFHLQRLKVHA